MENISRVSNNYGTTVHFGYNNDGMIPTSHGQVPSATFERIGTAYNGACNAEVIGVYDILSGASVSTVLVSRVTESMGEDNPMRGVIDVREVADYLYGDGSRTIHSSNELSVASSHLSELLNSKEARNYLAEGNALENYEQLALYMQANAASIVASQKMKQIEPNSSKDGYTLITGIKPEIFDQLKNAMHTRGRDGHRAL